MDESGAANESVATAAPAMPAVRKPTVPGSAPRTERRPGAKKRGGGLRWSRLDRRTVVWLGAAAAAVFACMALVPIRTTSIDFRKLARSTFAGEAAVDGTTYRETRWYELGPVGWDPYKEVRALRRDIGHLSDDDPRAKELLQKTRDVWDNSPTNPAMDGAAVRIPGYVVPLDQSKQGTREFLLVPYFGACIHTPAPPSNQIIHVLLERPKEGLHSMDNIWVSGTLKASRTGSSMGMSSYTMSARRIEPYVRRQD